MSSAAWASGWALRVRPEGLGRVSITAILVVAVERGLLPLQEVLGVTGHARASLTVVMSHLGESRQGEIFRMVARGLG
jgi:hypothetical protein